MCADEEEQVDVWLTHIHAAIHNDQSTYEFARFDPIPEAEAGQDASSGNAEQFGSSGVPGAADTVAASAAAGGSPADSEHGESSFRKVGNFFVNGAATIIGGGVSLVKGTVGAAVGAVGAVAGMCFVARACVSL
jgi:hypothetical protein